MRPNIAKVRQSGAALIVALLIAALVTVMGVRIGNEYQMTFRRASNVIYSDQTQLFLLSAETVAKQVLLADDEPTKDFGGEVWAGEFPPMPIANGLLAPAPIIDLQGRFNINTLDVTQTSGGQQQSQTEHQKMFVRLLMALPDIDMDTQRAQAISDAIADWLDEDSNERGFDGAEDSYYSQLDVPYRAANRPMQSISELRLIKGIDRELYRALAPHVTALDKGVDRINVNTATPLVLRALGSEDASGLEPLDEQSVSSYLESYEPAIGYDAQQFLAQPPWNTANPAPALLASTSSYFLASARAKLGELTLPMQSILWRKSEEVVVLSRSIGSL